jgi:protein SCO1/2
MRRWLVIAAGTLILLGGIAGGIALRQAAAPPVTAKKPATFALVDHDGRAVTDATYRGKHLVVFFGFTHCPDVCPTTMLHAAEILKDMGADAERTRVLFVTVDPARDTPEVLKAYLANFDTRIVGLTGSDEQIAAAAKAFGVHYARRAADSDYTMDHSTAVYRTDAEGNLLRAYLAGDTVLRNDLRAALAADADKRMVVSDAWLRASIGNVTTTAAYFVLKNETGREDRLMGVSTPVAGMAHIHESLEKDGVAQMRPVHDIALDPGESITLAPGGLHVMVMNLKAPLIAGEKVPLLLRFEKAGEVRVEAEVRGLK